MKREPLAPLTGFTDENEANSLLACVDVTTPQSKRLFNKWRRHDGSKAGCLVLPTIARTKMTLNHFGVSGGKDSTALLLWALHESGYAKDSLRFSFCDTENEHIITLAFIASLSDYSLSNGGPRIETLHPALGFYDLARHKHRFPAAKSRFCTEELKMLPTRKHILAMKTAGHEVILHSGVRAAESEDRAMLPARGFDGYYMATVYRPLLEWDIKDVWAIHKRYGIKPNPLYEKGAKRVGCFPCIMSQKMEIRMIAREFPEQIDRLRAEEKSFETASNGIQTFFARDKVPECHRTKPITTADQRKMNVCTIDDVVRWSMTVQGGKQYELIMDDDDFSEDDVGACKSSLGACE